MPKRVIDGEGLWRSEKLLRVQLEKFRAEYANQLPLALANGVFECDPRRVWSVVYAFNRPEVSIADVEAMQAEFERVGMLFRWKTSDGKTWGYWVGIERPGRLPSASRLKTRHETLGPEPPESALKAYVDSHRLPSGQPMVALGFGFGLGSGLGFGSGALAENRSLSSCQPSADDDAQSMPDACVEQCSKHSSSNAQAMRGNAPVSVPVPVREEKSKPLNARAQRFPAPTEEDDAARFAQFAEAYPPERKPTGPEWEDTLKIWKRLSVHEQLEATKSLTSWKESWGEDEPRYIPAMAKFLRLKRWQGQPPLKKEKSDGKRKQPGSDSTQDHIDRLRRNAKVLGLDNP